jgi:N-methylhydantoinase B/oxoprolinase/acetone carboxylase alpha subunit
MSSVALGGTRSDGSAWTYYETIGGGSGSGPGWAGESAVQCHMTNTLNTPAEAIEMQYPLRVRAFEALENGGSGLFHGGGGILREIEALEECEGTLLADRRGAGRPPNGLAGGGSGGAGRDEVRRAHGAVESFPSGKWRFALRAGDRLRIQTPGGGGWGIAD